MTLQLQRRKFTVEEYHKLIEAGILTEEDRVELINGEIITMSPSKSQHSGIIDFLVEYLIINLYQKVTVKCQNPLTLSDQSEPEPDILLAQYKVDSYQSAHPKPEEVYLIIEVSESTIVFDQTVKSELYAKANIPEYWIINLPDRQIEIHRQPKNGEYHFKQIISEEAEIECLSIAFNINFSEVFK